MRIFNITGSSRSGKTTSIEKIIIELTRRGFSVGTIKAIGCSKNCARRLMGDCSCSNLETDFTIDTRGKNSWRHREAGAKIVTTWAQSETAIIFPKKLSDEELLEHYALAGLDFVIIEGHRTAPYPRIVSAYHPSDAKTRLNDRTFAIIGKISEEFSQLDGIPCINVLEDVHKICNLIEYRAEIYKDHGD